MYKSVCVTCFSASGALRDVHVKTKSKIFESFSVALGFVHEVLPALIVLRIVGKVKTSNNFNYWIKIIFSCIVLKVE